MVTNTGQKSTHSEENNVIVSLKPLFTVDYILITATPGGVEIPYQTITTGVSFPGYASAYNRTIGYIGLWSVTWSVVNSAASASTAPPVGPQSVFTSGSLGGYATWWANDGLGHTDKVGFIINGPPVTHLIIGDRHYYQENSSVCWVTPKTPFTFIAVHNTTHYLYGNQSDPDVLVTMYKIDSEPTYHPYTGTFNLSGKAPYPVQHVLSYYSVGRDGMTESPHYVGDIVIDYTPANLTNPVVTPAVGNDSTSYLFNVTYVEDTGRPIDHFNQGGIIITPAPYNDMHPRKAIGFDGNEHTVWMSDRDGHWEIYYKKISPKGFGIRKDDKVKIVNQTIISETRISDNNGSDSVYPSLALEPYQQVFFNNTKYTNKYALLAGPVRYYYDQIQLLENNQCWMNTTPNLWQEIVAGRISKLTDLWVDIMVYKDPALQYNGGITLTITQTNPPGGQVFTKTISSTMVSDGKQWLAFYGRANQGLLKGTTYRITVSTNDPYKWYYTSGNPYSQGAWGWSSLDGAAQQYDFTFIIRYDFPELRFKYELTQMRTYLLSQGFTDDHIVFLTIPYWIYDGIGNAVKWRIPWSDNWPSVEWQPLPFNFSEPWIDGNATYTNFGNALTMLKGNATTNDLVVIYLQDHGGNSRPNGFCTNLCIMPAPYHVDTRIANDETQDGLDEDFGSYKDPTEENVASTFSWYDDELDAQLDKINYSDMAIIIDTCFSGGFIPDLSGPHRVVSSCGREDEETFSYVYRIYERLQDPRADTNGDERISIEEAHALAVKMIPIEQAQSPIYISHPQMNVDQDVHVVWVDKRDDPTPGDPNDLWEIYYSKLGSIIDCSAARNGVDITSLDWRVSTLDGKSSGRVVLPPFDSPNALFIEHPDISIDSLNNVSIVWSDWRNGSYEYQWEVYYQLQDNAPNSQGIPTTFIDDTRISNKPPLGQPEKDSFSPSLAIDRQNKVHIAWQETHPLNGAWEIMYEKLNPYLDDCDGDAAVDAQIALPFHNDYPATSQDGFDSASPSIAVDDSAIPHIAFMDKRPLDPGHETETTHQPGVWEVYTLIIGHIQMMPGGQIIPFTQDEKRQSDMNNPGKQYGSYTGPPDGYSMYPRIESAGSYLNGDTYLTWHDDRTGNWNIYYSEMANNGNNPAADLQVTTDTAADMYPDIALYPNNDSDLVWQTLQTGPWRLRSAEWNTNAGLNITIDGTTHHLLPFNPRSSGKGSGSPAYVYGTPLPVGTHTYRFSGDNGLYITQTGTFSGPNVYDQTPPVISNVNDTPDPQTTGGAVNISCTVTDNIQVSQVRVHITYPNTATVNQSMINIIGTNTYYYTTTYTLVGVYSYFIWANDTSGNSNTSGTYTFTIQPPPNNPPYPPSSPNPSNGTTNVLVSAILSWTGGDPDPSDTVTYDVYFGKSTSPSKVASNQSGTSYDPPGDMNANTTYYWKIISWDNHGASTAGPLWHFTTKKVKCGDANNDGIINVADVVYLINYLFIGGPEPVPDLCVGDVNGDGIVNISDVVYLINYLFINGPPPGGCCG